MYNPTLPRYGTDLLQVRPAYSSGSKHPAKKLFPEIVFTFNPYEDGSKPVKVSAYIYDSTGNLVSQTDPVQLDPGHSHTVNVNRDDLPLAGEEKTGALAGARSGPGCIDGRLCAPH